MLRPTVMIASRAERDTANRTGIARNDMLETIAEAPARIFL